MYVYCAQHNDNIKKTTSFSVGFLVFFFIVFCSFLDQMEINIFLQKKINKAGEWGTTQEQAQLFGV